MDINLSDIWPEWEIVSQISKGAYGQVYKAIRKRDSDVAAIKIISIPQDESETEKYRWEYSDDTIKGMYQKSAQEVLNEIDIMKKLRGSNNIVDILDYKLVEKEAQIGYDIYIRMELLQPMAHHLAELEVDSKRSTPFSMEDEAIKIGCDICRALETCHSVTTKTKNQIIHRDIKPDNILYHANGDIYKLGDFGISKELSKSGTDHTRSIGTLKYLAPEVEKGRYDCRADIYSLGLVLYYLTNKKKLPFVNGLGQDNEAVMRRLMGEQIPPPECASSGLAKVISKACAHRPEDRFSSAKEFRRALEFIGQQPITPEPPADELKKEEPSITIGTFGPKKKKRKPILWTLIVLLGLVAVFWFGTKSLPMDADVENDDDVTTTAPEIKEPPATEQTKPVVSEEQDKGEPGKTKETATKIILSNQYEVITYVDGAPSEWEHWYRLETTGNISNYFVSICGSDPTYSVECVIYDAQLTEIASDWSRDKVAEIGMRLDTNATYWIKLDGDEEVATYQFSVKEEVCDAGASRDQALPILLDTEYIKSIAVDKEVDWFAITTGPVDTIYRFYVNSKVNDNPVGGDTILALYDELGIKQDELRTDYGMSEYFDIFLPSNTTYTIKVSAEYTVPVTGDYLICVSQKTYDAGKDQQSATELHVGESYTAKLDSSFSDWYKCTFDESGRYKIELHNIDTGCRVQINGTRGSASVFSTSAKNEDSAKSILTVNAGDYIYLEVEPWGVTDAEIANGIYILSIAREES